MKNIDQYCIDQCNSLTAQAQGPDQTQFVRTPSKTHIKSSLFIVTIHGAEFSALSQHSLSDSVHCTECATSDPIILATHRRGYRSINVSLHQQLLTHRSPRNRAFDENEKLWLYTLRGAVPMQCLGVGSGIHRAAQYALKPTLSTSLAAMHASGSTHW